MTIHAERAWNPWRELAAKRRPFLAHVLTLLQERLAQQEYAPKRLKPLEQLRFDALVNGVICDLIYNYLWKESASIHLSRSNRILSKQFQRTYRPDWLTGKMLPKILDRLAGIGILNQMKGTAGQKPSFVAFQNQTHITPGETLISLIRQHGLTPHDILTNYTGQEIVVLKGEKDDYWSDADLVDYAESSDTTRFRHEMQALNAWLKQAPLAVRSSEQIDKASIDIRDRHLRRYFTRNSFTSGGRLFGGFWQPMSKQHRLHSLTMDGMDVVEKDFKCMMPRLLYGYAGLSLPADLMEDAYRIPGFEHSRAGIKKVFAALLFDTTTTDRKGFPRESKELFDRADLYAVGGKIGGVIEAIKKAHAPVAHLFGTGIGHALFFTESQVMVRLLLDLKDKGVVALPVHDAVMVSQKNVKQAELSMLAAFREIVGQEGMVSTGYRERPVKERVAA